MAAGHLVSGAQQMTEYIYAPKTGMLLKLDTFKSRTP